MKYEVFKNTIEKINAVNKKHLFALIVLVLSLNGFAGKPDHSIWDRYLSENVSAGGTPNYKNMKLRTDSLDAYLKQLINNPPAVEWTDNERMAYYINAYNAYTVKFILEKYPVTSVKDISFSGKDLWSFRMVNLGAATNYTLTQVQNDILRKMNEPRIHFALWRGSKSSPNLLNEAYMPDQLKTQLTAVTKAFLTNEAYNVLNPKKVQLSELFLTYADDFGSGSTLVNFLNQYSAVTINADAKVEYLPFDWTLK